MENKSRGALTGIALSQGESPIRIRRETVHAFETWTETGVH